MYITLCLIYLAIGALIACHRPVNAGPHDVFSFFFTTLLWLPALMLSAIFDAKVKNPEK